MGVRNTIRVLLCFGKRASDMIHYDLWLSNDRRVMAVKAQDNAARAAKMYSWLN